jgi:phenylalanyl-tRNA synthetase beta chain
VSFVAPLLLHIFLDLPDMKISYNRLKQYVDFKLSPKDLGEVLTGVGLEVESITDFESVKGGLAGVVVGEVLECSKHPDADKLSVTKVNIGSAELLQIVCGAPNVAAGQKVLVATVGCTLFPTSGEALSIKKAKIRGVESMGMICAEDELGLGTSHAGILVLENTAVVGTPASEYFNIEKDSILEIGLTPNRGDANSHIGVARDLAAALNVAYKATVSFTKPDLSSFEKLHRSSKEIAIAVTVENEADCPRYSGLSITNIEVKESPSWLKNFITSIGVKPINNIVDVTNFVLHEYGHPLHAFDADKISGNKIVVKKLAKGTPFTTLDNKELKLNADDLIVCNELSPMCIAGVYGGINSGVSESTKSIFLESAYFNPTSIRKTSTTHNLRTDAATHFEKGTDPNITIDALKRAALLIIEIAGGEIASEIIDKYPAKINDTELTISTRRILQLAGFEITTDTIKEILTRLEIRIAKEDGDNLYLMIPPFKTDVKREADIVEEILRIYGYNSFALPKKINSSLSFSPKIDTVKIENTIAELLAGAGYNEIWTNSVSKSKYEKDEKNTEKLVRLLNSQTAELDSLRATTLYSGLEVIEHNQNRKTTDLQLFEFGTTYSKSENTYTEQKHLSIFLTGKQTEDSWLGKSFDYNFYHLKSIVQNVLSKLGHHHFETKQLSENNFEFGLQLSNENAPVVKIGKISPSITKQFDLKNDVYFADFNWDYLLEKSAFNKPAFKELSKYPSINRDLAMIINDDLAFETIEKIAFTESKKLLLGVSLFDVYKGDKIEKGKKSYAVSFTFQHPDKTLTDIEVEKIMTRLMNKYEQELGAVIRKN